MKYTSTIFLRLTIIAMGLFALIFCTIMNYHLAKAISEEVSYLADYHYVIMSWIIAAAIPFYVALYQGMKLLHYIDTNTAFSEKSVRVLRIIKISAALMTVICYAGMPFVVAVAQHDDAPGVVLFCFAFFSAPLVISVFANVLQKLLHKAIELKSENDLTV